MNLLIIVLYYPMIYGLYLFDRHCRCVYNQRWNNERRGSSAGTTGQDPALGGLVGTAGMAFEEEAKLVYGVVLSIKNMMAKLLIDPT